MDILLPLKKNNFFPLKILLFSLQRTQSKSFFLHILCDDNVEEEKEDLKFFCNLFSLNIKFYDFKIEDISKELFFKSFNSFFIEYSFERILYLNPCCLINKDLQDFYNQDLTNISFVSCDIENYRFLEDFTSERKDIHLGLSFVLFNPSYFLKNSKSIKWVDPILYSLDPFNSTLLQLKDPFFIKRLCRTAYIFHTQCNNTISGPWLTESGKMKKEVQTLLEKRLLSVHPCFNCKYNISMSYDPVFNQFGSLIGVENVKVACFIHSQTNVYNERKSQILSSQPCFIIDCKDFVLKESTKESLEKFLEGTPF